MGSPTSTQSSSTHRSSSRTSHPSSERQSPTTSSGETSVGSETDLGPRPRLPRRIAPFDFGDGKDEIKRALELNRQLLLASQKEPLVDVPAVRAKIDELLSRLLDLG